MSKDQVLYIRCKWCGKPMDGRYIEEYNRCSFLMDRVQEDFHIISKMVSELARSQKNTKKF